MPTGGAFGGKEDVVCQIHVALQARVTGRSVRMVLTRPESMRVNPKRHATVITMKTGAARDGRILAQQISILGDTGAYASLGQPVMTRAATHSIGPYAVPNVDVECFAVYTNKPPAGAYRGFGATQAHFAAETQMDLIAEALRLSPFDIRRTNALRVGASTVTGQVLTESVGLLDCLERVEAHVHTAQALPAAELPRVRWIGNHRCDHLPAFLAACLPAMYNARDGRRTIMPVTIASHRNPGSAGQP